MKICKQCNKTWQNEFNICPICGGELMSEQQTKESVSMGDGNAINGGIHISKDYSQKYDNSLSSSNNTTNSNNSTVNNTTTQNFYGTMPFERSKTVKSQEEILLERRLRYRECCKQIMSDGIITTEERYWLEEQRVNIGVSSEDALSILKDVQNLSRNNVMSMGTVQRVQLNNFRSAVEGNMVDNIKRFLPQISANAKKFQDEELQYLYHLVLTALDPERCVKIYQNKQEDKYWMSFWVYVAFHKLGDVENAENVMIELGRWQGYMPDENLIVLAALGSLMDGDKELASEMYQAIQNEYSQLLTPVVNVMNSIFNYNPNDGNIIASLYKYRFYVDNFLSEIYQKEIETKRIAEEQKKSREEEERKRKAEEERKRKAEEEERKRKEEEERKRKAEEERKRKEEEERKRKAEEERKRKAEEEERKRREYEENDRYEGESRKCYCPKCGKGVNANTTFCSSCGHKLEKETKHVNVETKNSAKNYGSINGHEYVDLGLSVKWATCNMGSNKLEEYGDYYAWGEVNTKNDYTLENYDFCHEKKGLWSFGFGSKKVKAYDKLGGNISGTKYDAARTNWGGSWRLPTKSELEELVNKCTWECVTLDDVNGYIVTGPNGNSIFLPAADYRDGSSLHGDGYGGYYWSSTPDESDSGYAYYLYFNSVVHGVYLIDRRYGRSVRPVSE